ncbi:acyl-CoA synthetase (AMP-forming)/AMP-acid ligase II [Microbacterium resistens]|uniref:Acyl-CoA synthetase (AMP-forming)/AMP-acid ligase II n=1 Tax=Microbacterium resistens TaxID=156977 RepID=A0ABU1SFY1_9MICO|nr:class I adenylate-forming enzyme family protein [Microbacterium resistens]MDR6868490.1 acyl-CoA synthetase (AMP-forming)/AMP-acid ligase II [Microbacterium resistens]
MNSVQVEAIVTPKITLVRGAADVAFEQVRAIRAAGDIPLVGDERWPQEQWASVAALVRRVQPPRGAAWAALTSGSSGTPRIVVRTAESWRASFPSIAALLQPADIDDRDGGVLLPAPPSSSLTLFSLAHALEGDGPRPVFPHANTRDATTFHGTPHGLDALLSTEAAAHVHTALVGGSHLDAGIRARAESRGIRVIAYYGAAELSFVALDTGDGLRPFPGVDLDLRGGELWVRSPFLALGYLGDRGPLRKEGAWATVGDLAQIVDGTLQLRGRVDGAIQTSSATVVPEEVEASLRLVPGVKDAVVFALPTGNIGSLVAAMLEPESTSAPLTKAGLRAAVAARLAPAHRPRLWFTGLLPRNASGKPARAEVVRRVMAGEVDRVTG